MKITDIIKKNKRTLSFEVFPPKKADSFDLVKEAIEKIATLQPSYLSVTYGAGGGTSKYTLEIAKNIKDSFNVPTLEHLTCVSSSKKDIAEKINEIASSGVENILALRGDIPEDRINEDRSTWDFSHASELIQQIRASGKDFCIGGACYPEVHPEAKNSSEDIFRLKEKVDLGCDFLTSQMFFDNSLFYSFLYRLRDAGINVPVIAGIMPITSAKQIERARRLSGSFMPQKFLSLVDRFGDDDKAMKQAGLSYAVSQIVDLYANGVNNIHVYTMNNYSVAEFIKHSVSEIIK
ncbi:MAG: methylenetetrahydrofolate reductase [NAD(P)H] [Clostridia bacterium]|nr:methylenetetrahydrofolate reductase [NAD(P)H] [Clostridia bacterium]